MTHRSSRPFAALLFAANGLVVAGYASAQTAPPGAQGTPPGAAPVAPQPAVDAPPPAASADPAANPPAPAAPPAPADTAAAGEVKAGAAAEASASSEADVDAEVAAALAGLPEAEVGGPAGLEFYGFADLLYSILFQEGTETPSTFAIGNLNLYANADLGDNWRSLFEVRFLYLPHGSAPFLIDPTTPPPPRTDTTVADYADLQNSIRWGGISIQRAWLEYQLHPALTIRAGHYLTPYGIWNVDHGSPVIIGVRRPLVIGQALLPQFQTGLEAHGSLGLGPTELGYNLTLSNGRGPIDTHQDLDHNKAVGGRFYGKLFSDFGTLTLGVSGYKGKYTDSVTSFGFENNALVVNTDITARYDEFSFASDLKWEYEGALLQGEFVFNDVKFDEANRPAVPALDGGPAGFQTDYRRKGFYGLLGYRTPFLGTMPFTGIEYFDPGLRTGFPPITVYWLGLNIRPTPRVVFKVEYAYIKIHKVEGIPEGEDSSPQFIEFQTAWGF